MKMGPDAMIFFFWMLSFKPAFSVSSFIFIKRLFSFSSLSAIKAVSSPYLWELTFLMAILISACESSNPVFHIMYSAYKLNKESDSIQLWCTPFPIWKQCAVPCQVLTVASYPVYRLLRRQVRWSEQKRTDNTSLWQGIMVKVKVTQLWLLFATQWSIQSMEFSRPEY